MPRTLPQIRAVRQDGFHFDSGDISNGRETAERIYSAICGYVDEGSASTFKQRAKDSLITVFEACNKFSGLYKGNRGGKLVWELIAQEVILYTDLIASDVKTVVDVMVRARRNYSGQTRPTRLTSLVDKFISADEEMRRLGPATTTTLTINPAGARIANSDVDSLARTLRGAGINAEWPPSYFTTGDLVSLADDQVQEALGTIHGGSPDSNIACPTFVSIPIDLRIFLCRLGLVYYRPEKNWALSLSAVGFFNNVHRQDWYGVMGRQWKVLWTLDRFLDSARDAFTSRGKEFYVGVLVHWLHKAENIERSIDVTQTDPLQIWAEHRGLRRYGTVMVLRRVNFKLQVIWYDPWLHNPAVKEPYLTRQTEIFEYRSRVVERIQVWAQGMVVPIHSRYLGGIGAGVGGHDSVTMSMKWLGNLISAPAGMGAMFPDPDDEREFRRQGFIKTDEE